MAEDINAAREHWVGLGLDPAAFDAAASDQRPAAAPAPAPSAGPDAANPMAGFMPPNVAAGARDQLSRGVAPDVVRCALEDGGYAADAIDNLLGGPAVEKNEDLAALNQGGLRGVSSAAEIGPVSYDRDSITHLNPVGLAELDGQVKQAAVDMEVPPAAAASVCAIIVEQAARYAAVPADQKQLHRMQEGSRLVQACGGAGAAREAIDLAATAIKQIKSDAFLERLAASGALSSPEVVIALAHAARISGLRGRVSGGESLAQITGALFG